MSGAINAALAADLYHDEEECPTRDGWTLISARNLLGIDPIRTPGRWYVIFRDEADLTLWATACTEDGIPWAQIPEDELADHALELFQVYAHQRIVYRPFPPLDHVA